MCHTTILLGGGGNMTFTSDYDITQESWKAIENGALQQVWLWIIKASSRLSTG
jgi:hypothetical protein